MSSRSIGVLLAALIIALTLGMIIIFFWSLHNRVPPASAAAKPMVQGAPSSRLPVAGNATPARVLVQGGKPSAQ
jgi:flagellar basal body-associated protein FliL